MSEYIFISKNLKPWVKNDVQAMNLAYNECWKQKEKLEKENERLKAFKESVVPVLENMLISDTVPDHSKKVIKGLVETTEQGDSDE